MRRRRTQATATFPLPWPLEVVFWVIGLACVPVAIWWLVNEITSPAETFGAILGVPVESQGIVESAQPLIWLFGFAVGVRVRFWVRGLFVDRLNRLLQN